MSAEKVSVERLRHIQIASAGTGVWGWEGGEEGMGGVWGVGGFQFTATVIAQYWVGELVCGEKYTRAGTKIS